MTDPHVTHAQNAGLHVLRYYGRVDYMFAPAIQRFVDELIAHNQINAMVIDLTEAECLDSTNLGLLARLANRLRNAQDTPSLLVSTNEDINCVIRSMSLDESMDLIAKLPGEGLIGEINEIPTSQPSPLELKQTMIDAHRALMSLSEAGRVQFQDVVACLCADNAADDV